jgi:hydrogenase-4 component B
LRTDAQVVFAAAVLLALSGIPGLFLSRRASGAKLSVALTLLASLVGSIGAIVSLVHRVPSIWSVEWALPVGSFAVKIDALAAVFLFPIFIVSALGCIYGLRYWSDDEHPHSAARLRAFYGLLAGALAAVVLAGDGVLFLISWEVMALAAYFLVTIEDEDAEVRRVGWIYLVASHVSALALIGVFALLKNINGTFALHAIPDGVASPAMLTTVFVLAVIGFGLKAGIMPLHVWLPGAHANAPSHVSAIMSGVLIKMGVYGLARVCSLLPHPPASWGAALLILGAISGVLGLAFAIGQKDLKRVLAYSSVENIGIIFMGLGLAMLGRAAGRPAWIVLGLGGALLHVWNHALFKSLLFLAAGSVIHGAGTRNIDRLGGLSRKMRWTSLCFVVGAVAICGLPPLNGFVSELLIYVGLFKIAMPEGGGQFVAAAFVAPALAAIGALAVACFVRLFGTVFLGEPRTLAAEHAHEAPAAMLGPMAVLAGCCVFLGVLPLAAAPALDRAIATWTNNPAAPLPAINALVPLGWLSLTGLLLIPAVVWGTWRLLQVLRAGAFHTVGTWDCGYTRPTTRMQYTGSSLGQILVALFAWALRPRVQRPQIDVPFPTAASFESRVDDTVLDGGILPLTKRLERLACHLRFLQAGRVQFYILYILVIAVVLLIAAARGGGVPR